VNLGTAFADLVELGDLRAPVTDQRRRAIILRLGGVVLSGPGHRRCSGQADPPAAKFP
jgi:hypothetical protein